MTRTFQLLLAKVFPVVALSGLLLAAWILVVEPSFTVSTDSEITGSIESIESAAKPAAPSVYADLGVR